MIDQHINLKAKIESMVPDLVQQFQNLPMEPDVAELEARLIVKPDDPLVRYWPSWSYEDIPGKGLTHARLINVDIRALCGTETANMRLPQ